AFNLFARLPHGRDGTSELGPGASVTPSTSTSNSVSPSRCFGVILPSPNHLKVAMAPSRRTGPGSTLRSVTSWLAWLLHASEANEVTKWTARCRSVLAISGKNGKQFHAADSALTGWIDYRYSCGS